MGPKQYLCYFSQILLQRYFSDLTCFGTARIQLDVTIDTLLRLQATFLFVLGSRYIGSILPSIFSGVQAQRLSTSQQKEPKTCFSAALQSLRGQLLQSPQQHLKINVNYYRAKLPPCKVIIQLRYLKILVYNLPNNTERLEKTPALNLKI